MVGLASFLAYLSPTLIFDMGGREGNKVQGIPLVTHTQASFSWLLFLHYVMGAWEQPNKWDYIGRLRRWRTKRVCLDCLVLTGISRAEVPLCWGGPTGGVLCTLCVDYCVQIIQPLLGQQQDSVLFHIITLFPQMFIIKSKISIMLYVQHTRIVLYTTTTSFNLCFAWEWSSIPISDPAHPSVQLANWRRWLWVTCSFICTC